MPRCHEGENRCAKNLGCLAQHSFFQENSNLGVQVLGLPGMFLLTTNTPQKSYMVTLTETNIALENRLSQKETSIPSILRGHVSVRECTQNNCLEKVAPFLQYGHFWYLF